MASLGEVKNHALRLFLKGQITPALRLYDAIIASAPLHLDARLKVADCLALLDHKPAAATVYRAAAWYAIKSGHPLSAVVAARVVQSLGGDADDLLATLVVRYGSGSEFLGPRAARVNLPGADTAVAAPDLSQPAPADLLAHAAERARTCTDAFDEYPAVVHPIPLLSEMTEAGLRRVLAAIRVQRLPDGAHAIRAGESGRSLFFVASGELRVIATGPDGAPMDLARLHENAVFGEMALLSAQPRSASVQVVDEADLLELPIDSLRALAHEAAPIASALHHFTRQRMLKNLMSTSPLFRPFDRKQQRDLLLRFTSHDVDAGTVIIDEGDPGTGLFLVLSGDVAVSKRSGAGAAALATLRCGDVFGEMSLMNGSAATATVTASTAATLLFLSRDYVDRLVAGIPEIKNYLHALSENRQLDIQLALGGLEIDEELGAGEEIVFL